MATETVNEAQADDRLDVHDSYRMASECGYHHDLLIDKNQAQGLAARLRGISCITGVLMTDGVDTDLGEYLRGGLVEAVHALVEDAAGILEHINTRAEKAAQAAA